MIPLRFLLAGAGVVLALGGGTALAAPTLMASVSHGGSASAAAQSCSHATGDAHGDCASAAAGKKSDTSSSHGSGATGNDSNSAGSSNDAHGDAVSAAAKSCAHGNATDPGTHGECVSAVAKSNSTHAGGH